MDILVIFLIVIIYLLASFAYMLVSGISRARSSKFWMTVFNPGMYVLSLVKKIGR